MGTGPVDRGVAQCAGRGFRMRCERCGTELHGESAFCRACGEPVVPYDAETKEGRGTSPVSRHGKRSFAIALATAATVAVAIIVTMLTVSATVRTQPSPASSDDDAEQHREQPEPDKAPAPCRHDWIPVMNLEKAGMRAGSEQEARDIVISLVRDSGYGDFSEQLGDCEIRSAPDSTCYRFSQVYEGIPVYGTDIMLTTDESGACTMLSGDTWNLHDVDTVPAVTEDDALRAVRIAYGDDVTIMGKPSLLILPEEDAGAALVYRVSVSGGSRYDDCLVRADTGEVVRKTSRVIWG